MIGERAVLGAIIPRRRDLLHTALARVEEEHFADANNRFLWRLLCRYYETAGEIVSREALTVLLQRQNRDAAEQLMLEELFDALSGMEVQEHEFRFSIETLRDRRAEQLTGESITTAYEILERGMPAEQAGGKRGEVLQGHSDARNYLFGALSNVERLSGQANTMPEGDIRKEGTEIKQAYADRKSGKIPPGVRFGIDSLDRHTGGAHKGELDLVCAYTGEGKASPLWTPVLTPNGWRKMGELQVGDEVIGRNGRPTRILQTHDRGVMDTYRVTTSDGGTVVTAADHLWTIQDQNDRAGKTAYGWGRTMTTAELAYGRSYGRRFYLPLMEPAQYAERKLPLDPYLIGALAGDGSMYGRNFYLNINPNDDGQIMENAWLADGDEWVLEPSQMRYRVRGTRTRQILKSLGMWEGRPETKHIPEPFLLGSPAQRLAVIQGIMDTDGTCLWNGRSAELRVTSRRLAENLRELVWSLGGSCNPLRSRGPGKQRLPDGTYKEGLEVFATIIRLPEGMCPFRLQRKADRWAMRSGSKRSMPFRAIRTIEPVGKEPVRCISVAAEDNLYVTEDYIVTHNSMLAAQMAWHACVMQGMHVYFATSETVREQVSRRIVARHSRMPQFNYQDGLDSNKIKNGTLDPTEERLLNEVVDDFTTNPKYGTLHIAQVPRDGTLGHIEARARRWHNQQPIDLLVIDYLALIKPDRHRQSSREEFNDVLKGAKHLATTFDDGNGIPLVSPWQMSQAAYKEAVRLGAYTLANLAETSEAEKSADLIMSIYRDPDGNNAEAKLQLLKVRDGAIPGAMTLELDYRTTFMTDRQTIAMTNALLD